MAYAYEKLGKKGKAIEVYKQSVSAHEQATGLRDYQYYILGNAYYSLGQFDRAIDAYVQAIRIKSNFAPARFNLGVTYARLNRKNDAREQYSALKMLDASRAEKLRKLIDDVK